MSGPETRYFLGVFYHLDIVGDDYIATLVNGGREIARRKFRMAAIQQAEYYIMAINDANPHWQRQTL